MDNSERVIKSFLDLDVYKRSYRAGVKSQKLVVFLRQIKGFGEADQLSRSSKAVPALIAEGYAKRYQVKHLQKYIDDAIGEANESIVHVSFARELGFLDKALCDELNSEYVIIAKELYNLGKKWSESKNSPKV